MTYSIYNLTDGVFTGLRLGGDAEFIAVNLPAGCGAWPGGIDPLRERVDIPSQGLVAYQPPAPPADGLRTWEWSAALWRWQPVPTLVAVKARKWEEIKAARDAAISAPLATDWGMFDHDPKARAAIQEMATGASVTSSDVVATLADNTTVKLQPRQIAAVLALSFARVQLARETATELRDQVDLAASTEAVAAVAWPETAG